MTQPQPSLAGWLAEEGQPQADEYTSQPEMYQPAEPATHTQYRNRIGLLI